MAYDPTTGLWKPESDSVATGVSNVLKKTSPLMKQAETTGLQLANKRGLLNSSMAVGAAQGEMIKAATPIAMQDAAQMAAKNLSSQGYAQTGMLQGRQFEHEAGQQAERLASTEGMQERQIEADVGIQQRDIAAQMDRLNVQVDQRMAEVLANIASNDREKATAATTAMMNIYNEGFKAILANPEIDADTRGRYLEHIAATRDSDLELVEQLYNIDLTWASPVAAG